jgi:hypothetical protein
MEFEVLKTYEDAWLVEAIDCASEGELYPALFYGLDAEKRAREYAAWKNARSEDDYCTECGMKAGDQRRCPYTRDGAHLFAYTQEGRRQNTETSPSDSIAAEKDSTHE